MRLSSTEATPISTFSLNTHLSLNSPLISQSSTRTVTKSQKFTQRESPRYLLSCAKVATLLELDIILARQFAALLAALGEVHDGAAGNDHEQEEGEHAQGDGDVESGGFGHFDGVL